MECPICTLKYTDVARRKISCTDCDSECCRICFQQWILSSEPSCMKCKKPYTLDSIIDKVGASFVSKKYKPLRKQKLFENEMALMVETQPFADLQNLRRQYEKKKNVIQEKIDDLANRISSYRIQYNIRNRDETGEVALKNWIKVEETMSIFQQRLSLYKAERKVYSNIINRIKREYENIDSSVNMFIMRCNQPNCRGFIDKEWHCSLCNTNICSDCFDVKLSDHTCEDEKKITVSMIKKDTKACPKCRTLIHKIDGCDQIFCTLCHAAFSWTTLQLVQKNERIHNPHYFEVLRGRGGIVPRELNDVPCGGLPENTILYNKISHLILEAKGTPKEFETILFLENAEEEFISIYGLHNQIRTQHIPKYVVNTVTDNMDLRIKYLLKDIDEETFKSALYSKEKQNEVKKEIGFVLQTFQVSTVDTILHINEANTMDDILNLLKSMVNLKDSINQAFTSLKRKYNCSTPYITADWFMIEKA